MDSQQRAPHNNSYKFFIANVDFQTTASQVDEFFCQFGNVNQVKLLPPPPNGGGDGGGGMRKLHRGHGFIYMLDEASTYAVENFVNSFPMNKIDMLGRRGVQVRRQAGMGRGGPGPGEGDNNANGGNGGNDYHHPSSWGQYYDYKAQPQPQPQQQQYGVASVAYGAVDYQLQQQQQPYAMNYYASNPNAGPATAVVPMAVAQQQPYPHQAIATAVDAYAQHPQQYPNYAGASYVAAQTTSLAVQQQQPQYPQPLPHPQQHHQYPQPQPQHQSQYDQQGTYNYYQTPAYNNQVQQPLQQQEQQPPSAPLRYIGPPSQQSRGPPPPLQYGNGPPVFPSHPSSNNPHRPNDGMRPPPNNSGGPMTRMGMQPQGGRGEGGGKWQGGGGGGRGEGVGVGRGNHNMAMGGGGRGSYGGGGRGGGRDGGVGRNGRDGRRDRPY